MQEARGDDMVSEHAEAELVLGRFARLDILKVGHQNGKETAVWAC